MSLGLFCFILCLGWQYAAGSPVTVTKYEYVREADAWLRLHIVPATWSDAAVRCQLEGGVLASPTTSAMTQAMKTVMDKHNLRHSEVFIGVTDLFSKGNFRSLDGLGLADSLHWALGEPDNGGDAEDCLALTSLGTLADVSCARLLPYFCRKSAYNCSSIKVEDSTDLITSTDNIRNSTPLVTQFSNVKGPATSRTGYEYMVQADAWLRLHIVPATWPDARLRCHLEGGVIASPTSNAISTAMSAMMAANKMTMRYAFIGVHAFITKGDFMSMDGVPLANLSLRWREGEPNNEKNDEDCIVLNGVGEANDVSCNTTHPYFCLKQSNKMTVNKCGTTADGYKLESCTGSCYKFHRIARTWKRAAMTCHAEGGHLAVINSNEESRVLKEIFEPVPKNDIKGGDPNLAFVGVWDWEEHGDWLTIFGESLTEAGFEGWSRNEPNNAGGVEFCGAIKRDGRLNDYSCNSKLPFICEITPK